MSLVRCFQALVPGTAIAALILGCSHCAGLRQSGLVTKVESQARLAERRKEIRVFKLETALAWVVAQGGLPRSVRKLKGLCDLTDDDLRDDWGNYLQVRSSDDGKFCELVSLGGDGLNGGEGAAADWIVNRVEMGR